MTGLELIERSLRTIGVLASGETASAAEGADGLVALNDMVDQWSTEKLAVFSVARQTFSLTLNQQTYTMGTGGNFNVARPARIERASIIQLSNPSLPLELKIDILSEQQWQRIPVKGIASSLPKVVYIDDAFPLRNLSYWSIPNVAVDTALYTWTAISAFTLAVDQTFPPGYAKALRYNLALDLAPEYGAVVSPTVLAQAIDSKAKIKSHNITPPILTVDIGMGAENYNYLDDTRIG